MKRNYLFLIFILPFLFLASCEPLGETITSTEEWGCLINSDGTGFEWFMRGSTTATFTQDSQKIVYKTNDGIFTKDFSGNVTQISDVAVSDYKHISPDLRYLLSEEDNDIYLSDIDGLNKINLTNTPSKKEFQGAFSSDGKKITYLCSVDSIYSFGVFCIDEENSIEVYPNDVQGYANPELNVLTNEIIYISNYLSAQNDELRSIDIYDNNQKTISTSIVGQYELSGDGSLIAFEARDSVGIKKLYTYNFSTLDTRLVSTQKMEYSIDFYGRILATSYGAIRVIDLDTLEWNNIDSGSDIVISPDGEKIFFIKSRKLPIDD